jgi:hypothetical protein
MMMKQFGVKTMRSMQAVRRLSAAAAADNVVEKKKMNLFTALNDGMKVAMQTDPTAILFGEGTRDLDAIKNVR